ncbi:metal ABC transporter permease [Longimicrobium terrae]|uniref:Manganese/zinc/iron transport system permease protein n=1 Tax=Longimicrobium terrae TaxID=1639882 RepID=A0A841GYL3_9BACT|nr:metal ABC transporter permease [Longimicrobium terrae]MBB4636626.1 manganese/zinc/iron transport system permease protein [Longimicrobium terrae]MBB6070850.1 manganese/zinc/iron transport system permease protein [Longimicrobium terrae]NNC28876.1 metal ABC transporter permease [Longimicrobium terrae]
MNFWTDYTLRIVALGAAALGLTSGALGSFAVLRKQSLLGDAISHAALPGIALAFLLTGSKAPLVLVAGAGVAGWVGTLVVMRIVNATRIKEDSALGIVLAVFFGFGLVLLTLIQKRPDASQAGLDRFLFGQAATLLQRDVLIISVLGGIALLVAAIFWKEFKLLSFDPDFATSIGLPVRMLDIVLTSVLVLSIVIGLQTVGVVLMSAMVVAPAAAARQWTDRLGRMVVLAGGFGALAGVSGAVISSAARHVPTGPTIVLCLTVLVLFSMAFAPTRGLVWAGVRQARNRRTLHMHSVLADLQTLALQHPEQERGHATAVLEVAHPGALHELRELEQRGWARRRGDDWAITEDGRREAATHGRGADYEEEQ